MRISDWLHKRKRTMGLLLLGGIVFLSSGCGKASKAYDTGMELVEKAKYEEASAYFEKAVKENDEKAEYYIAYGMTLNHIGRYEEAVEQFKKAYQDVDNKISRRNNKQLFYGEAVAAAGMGKYEEAVSNCDKAAEIKESEELNQDILITRAAIKQLNGDTQGALDDYQEVIKTDESCVDAYLQRAELEGCLGNSEDAASDYQTALEQDKECFDAYFGLYYLYEEQGQEDAAKETLNQILKMEEKDADILLQKGRAYYCLKDYENSKEYLEKAGKEGIKSANYYLGLMYMDQGSFSEAKEQFEKFQKEGAADQDGISISEVYNQLAGCMIGLDDYKSAQNYLSEGLQTGDMKGKKLLIKNQVILYERMKKYNKAKKAAKTYLELFPNDTEMKKELNFIKTRIAS